MWTEEKQEIECKHVVVEEWVNDWMQKYKEEYKEMTNNPTEETQNKYRRSK